MSVIEVDFIVRAVAIQEEDLIEEEDREVAGDHTISLPIEVLEWSQGKQASRVLDDFHSSVAVGMLEDFEFSVIAPDGQEIYEDDEEGDDE